MNDLSKVSIKRIEGLEATIADIYAKVDEASKKGTAHSVGEVFWSQSNLAEENVGALPLFTGDHVAASTYSALHAFILRHNELVKTKQEYDALVADTTKDCPYYAIDNGQIYLPIIRNYPASISTANNQLSVEDTNLYPWVSYVLTVHDIVTPTEYAKADLSNVTGIDQQSAVSTALEGKQDVLPAGTTGHYLQKTANGVQWAAVQGGGGLTITVQTYDNQTGTTLATGLTLSDFSTILVYKNGVLLTSGATNDYTINTNDIEFTSSLLATDKVTLICFGSAS